jgi:hypothetical protein
MSEDPGLDPETDEYDRLEQQAATAPDEEDNPDAGDQAIDPTAADEADQLEQALSAGDDDEEDYPGR